MTCLRPLTIFALLLSAAPAAAEDPFAGVVRPFLARHCIQCHGPDEQQSQLRYDRLEGMRVEDRHLWTLIHQQLTTGEMPPKGQPRPDPAEMRQVLDWIQREQRGLRSSDARRLNRRELSALLCDVTGLNVDFAAALPGDGKVNGFDTGADGLQDAADSVAQTMQITRRAVDALTFLDAPASKTITADLTTAKDLKQAFDRYKADGVTIGDSDTLGQPGTGLLLRPKWVGDRGGMTIRVPPPARLGILRLKLTVSVKKYFDAVPNPRLWVEVGGKDLDYVELDNPPDRPRTLEYQVALADVVIETRGVSVTLSNRVEVPYAVPGFDNDEKQGEKQPEIPGGMGLYRPFYDRKERNPELTPVPYVVLHSIEIEPDYHVAWPPASWNAGAGAIADDLPSTQRLLSIWIERAWRRPVKDAEQQRFIALYQKLRDSGMSFDDSLRAAFQSVLLSGSCRYLASPAEADTHSAQHALASRLSFMFWGAPPDAELLDLAAAGKLRDPAVLDKQVDRLLAGPRSDGFLRPFVTQWLEMGQPITIAMDHIQKQDFRFGRYLKASMQEETVCYMRQALLDNRPARELIASDWTMMNDILARHYGYSGIEGGQVRKVVLRNDDPRGGGLLGHAGIQSMLCWMGENWVIYRGAWALRHILDDPPPPPPLEVPELTPSESKNHGKTFRELLRQHQEDARCSVCHQKIDPLGFAFQNFDLSGRWRDVEHDHYARSELDGKIAWKGEGATRPVDTAGRLPRGEEYASYQEFKSLMVKHYTTDLVRGLLKNLLLYGTGRKADIADLATIDAILAEHQREGYPLKSMLKSLVKAPAFAR